MQKNNSLLVALAALSLAIGGISCKKSNSSDLTPTPPVMDVQLATNANLGSVLTDSAGRTLYFFSMDAADTSACTGGCLTTWPVFNATHLNVGTGLDTSDFKSMTRSDGKIQTTYKGWPLYYFQNDSKAGDVNGEAVGGIWFVAKPDYTIMLAKGQLVGKDGVSYDSTYTPNAGKTLYLTDAWGVTLYAFAHDKADSNSFTKSDFSNDNVFPIFQVGTTLVAPSTIDKSLLSSLNVFGKTQFVFNGWPIYYYGVDNKVRGSTQAVSFPAPGIWPVINQYSPAAPQ
jgi:predicted lipoprotein with Yx(FWY)xxD motif